MRQLARYSLALSIVGLALLPSFSLAKKGSGGTPQITITSPANNATVAGTVTIAGTASDSIQITSVAVSVDGGPYANAVGAASWTYNWNTNGYPNGGHTIGALVTDSSGSTATASVQVTVNNPVAAGPPPVPANFFGLDVQSTGIWPSAAGVPFGTVRLWDSATKWNQIETSKGNYNWTTLDSIVTTAYQNGQTVMYTFGGVPSFYSSNPTDKRCGELSSGYGNCDAPADVNANGSGTDANFKSFVTAFMQHLQSLQKSTGATVQYFEVWNEMNNYQTFWNGTAAQLVRMAADARSIIKSYNPNALVLTPSTCNCGNSHFTGGAYSTTNPQDGMAFYLQTSVTLPSGAVVTGATVADGISFHPYLDSPSPEGIVNLIANMQAVMAATGVSNLPLLDTESSWGQNNVVTGCSAAPPFTQTCHNNMTAFLARSYILAASNGLAQLDWYQWGNTTSGTLYNPANNNVFEAAGAYGVVEHWLVGAAFQSACQSSNTTYTCNLVSPAGVHEQIVWNTAGSSSFSAPNYTHCATVDGSICTVSGGNVTIGPKPLLLTP